MSSCCGGSSFNCTSNHERCFNCTCSCYEESYVLAAVDSFCKLLKSLPGEKCTIVDDCVNGLICLRNTTCACKAPCLYDDSIGVCDCGVPTFETPLVIIAMGLFLAFLSTFVWIFCIMSVLHRSDKFTAQFPSRVTRVSVCQGPSRVAPIFITQPANKYTELQEGVSVSGLPEVSVSDRPTYGSPMKYPYYETIKGFNNEMDEAGSSSRQQTPNPYATLDRISAPPTDSYRPIAPVIPQYPSTLLSSEEARNINYFS